MIVVNKQNVFNKEKNFMKDLLAYVGAISLVEKILIKI